ncbi:MAG: endonuclease/exonuclease/phosphatase family protein [Planctomycetota bacterium]|nr:endonuclease/exonuclease/phosphatase family protein [Planctomycetota bacterium]
MRCMLRPSCSVLLCLPLFLHPCDLHAQSAEADSFGPGHRYGRKQAPSSTEGAIRVASYNVLNYFDEVDDPALSGEWDDKDLASSPSQLQALADAIRALDADVLALQEVESREALVRFRDAYLPDLGYDHVASIDAGYYRGVEQSVLSRIPITEATNWPGLSIDEVKRSGPGFQPLPEKPVTEFQRSPLMVDLETEDGYRFTLLVVHLKSGGKSQAYRREGEGLKLVELVKELEDQRPDRNIVVLGDFNAKYSYKSMRLLFESGLVDTMQCRATEPSDEDTPLWVTHESGRTLDYILVNSAMYNEVVPGSAFVLGTLYPGDSTHYNWRTDDPPPGHASDHYPVAVEFIPSE